MKKVVRFLRFCAAYVVVSVVMVVLGFKIANLAVARFPILSDNHSHGWGIILSLSMMILARVASAILSNEKVRNKIAGNSSSRRTIPDGIKRTDIMHSGQNGVHITN